MPETAVYDKGTRVKWGIRTAPNSLCMKMGHVIAYVRKGKTLQRQLPDQIYEVLQREGNLSNGLDHTLRTLMSFRWDGLGYVQSIAKKNGYIIHDGETYRFVEATKVEQV